MATTNRRPAPARKRPTSTARNQPTGKGRARGSRSKKASPKPGYASRLAPALRRGDTWGAVLLVVAALVALGVWLDAAGPVGRGIGEGVEALVGLAAVFVPLLLAAAALVLLRPPPEGPGDATGRWVVGSTVTRPNPRRGG